MLAGRDLDALVAEKVMGYPAFAWQAVPILAEHVYQDFDTASPCLVCGRFDGSAFCLPHYSTDIAAAWEVVERLKVEPFKGRELVLEIYVSAEVPDETEVSVQWFDDDQGYGPFYLLAKTAPHAICLAALKAVGG